MKVIKPIFQVRELRLKQKWHIKAKIGTRLKGFQHCTFHCLVSHFLLWQFKLHCFCFFLKYKHTIDMTTNTYISFIILVLEKLDCPSAKGMSDFCSIRASWRSGDICKPWQVTDLQFRVIMKRSTVVEFKQIVSMSSQVFMRIDFFNYTFIGKIL